MSIRQPQGLEPFLNRPIAHRGLHDTGVRPENSLPAFSAAIARGFPIELDVQITRNGQAVVFHDENFQRMTGRSARIESTTLDEVRTLLLKGTDQCIPTLKEVLALVSGQVPLLIEIKNRAGRKHVAPAVWSDLKDYIGSFAIQSFHSLTLSWFRIHAPHVIRGQLAGESSGGFLNFPLRLLRRTLLVNLVSRPDFVAYDLHALPYWEVSLWRKKRPVLVWTVRSKADQLRALVLGDNFIFDSANGFDPDTAAPGADKP